MSSPAAAGPKAKKQPNLISLTTVNEDGSHFKLHPADVKGRFTFWRRVSGFLILAAYTVLPWIQIKGHPAVFLDVVNRRFHLLGFTLVVEDLFLLFFVISGLGFGLFFVTSLFGRIWCGWTCPYTVFLDHVYRRIERLVDGDAAARRKLDRAPMTSAKAVRRGLKHGLYLLASVLIAHIFLSYFVSIPKLYEFMQGPPSEHLVAFGIVVFFTVALYGCFSWFREQFCIILCPYGRIQSALTDDNTMVIGYDTNRGEPRGKVNDPDAGACVSCNRCVQVCPTGIDIRNGLQLECIGCAACVDACDNIMDKVGRARGLIRYDSLNGLQGKRTRWLRPRIFLYTALMLIGALVMTVALTRVDSTPVSFVRMRGMPFYVQAAAVRNQFQANLMNKTREPVTFTISVENPPTGVSTVGLEKPIEVAPESSAKATVIINFDREHYNGPTQLVFDIATDRSDEVRKQRLKFLGPDPRLFLEEDGVPTKPSTEGQQP